MVTSFLCVLCALCVFWQLYHIFRTSSVGILWVLVWHRDLLGRVFILFIYLFGLVWFGFISVRVPKGIIGPEYIEMNWGFSDYLGITNSGFKSSLQVHIYGGVLFSISVLRFNKQFSLLIANRGVFMYNFLSYPNSER